MSTQKYTSSEDAKAMVAQGARPLLLQFSADWCSPCRQMGPMVEEVAVALSGVVDIVKIDVDKDKPFADSYNVSGIPHFVLVKDGAVSGRLAGHVPRSRFTAFVEDHI